MGFFKQLVSGLQGRKYNKVNPERFDDPIASEISWKPASRGGRTFVERKLVETDPMKMEFVATIYAKLTSILLLLVGAGLLGYSLYNLYINNNLVTVTKIANYLKQDFWKNDYVILTLFGLGMLIWGIIMLRNFLKPTLFNKYTNQFMVKSDERSIYDIHALQIITERVHTKHSYFYSYELNLVLKNQERINILDNKNQQLIRTNGKKLSRFLSVPLWDGSRQSKN